MRQEVYEIDDFGFTIEVYDAEVDANGVIVDEDKKSYISAEKPQGLYKAKWVGSEWIEGATDKEIKEINKVEPTPPTELELLRIDIAKENADLFEIMIMLIGGN